MNGNVATSTRGARRWLQAAPFVAAIACGGPQELGAAGTTCFRDTECAPGLICVAPMVDDVNRVCSNDPTPLISNVDGPPVVEPMGGSAGAAGAMAGGGMGAVAGGGAAAVAGGGMGAVAGGGNAGTATGGSAGTGGTDAAGTGGTGGTAGTGGTEPEGGAPT